MRFEQTLLFVPADRPERFSKAFESGTDAVILDLEDAVSSDRKDIARREVLRCLSRPLRHRVYVRLNGTGTQWHGDDLNAIQSVFLSGLMLPKASSAAQIDSIVERIGGRIPLVARVETAEGMVNLRQIAAHPAVDRIAFGSIDFVADTDMEDDREALLYCRSQIVLHSRAAGLAPPLDGVTLSVNGSATVLDDSRYARKLGFGGKLCIHPRQIEPTRLGFSPTDKEIAWAREVCAVADIASRGAIAIQGKMIDRPVIERARRILNSIGG
jgi:citrate lyase subunit beta / citryl-CoA lyase